MVYNLFKCKIKKFCPFILIKKKTNRKKEKRALCVHGAIHPIVPMITPIVLDKQPQL